MYWIFTYLILNSTLLYFITLMDINLPCPLAEFTFCAFFSSSCLNMLNLSLKSEEGLFASKVNVNVTSKFWIYLASAARPSSSHFVRSSGCWIGSSSPYCLHTHVNNNWTLFYPIALRRPRGCGSFSPICSSCIWWGPPRGPAWTLCSQQQSPYFRFNKVCSRPRL